MPVTLTVDREIATVGSQDIEQTTRRPATHHQTPSKREQHARGSRQTAIPKHTKMASGGSAFPASSVADEVEQANQETSESSLLKLPKELRNLIWKYALTEDDNILINQRCADKPVEPALARVCRQLRHETGNIYWEINCFDISLMLPPQIPRTMWMVALPPVARHGLARSYGMGESYFPYAPQSPSHRLVGGSRYPLHLSRQARDKFRARPRR